MGWFFAPMYDRFLAGAERAFLQGWRKTLLAEASGLVVEIGAGTGANLAAYPDAVTELHLCEPDAGMRHQLERKLAPLPLASRSTVHAAPAEALPFADHSVDVVVSTLVLCTVGELGASIAELRRVLKPGGRLLFLEHIGAHEDRVWQRRWQAAADPAWALVAGGCHLTRRQHEALRAGGFRVDEPIEHVLPGGLGLVQDVVSGIAIAP